MNFTIGDPTDPPMSFDYSMNSPIYIGLWTNWSHGKILGATLTLSQRNGSFLIAFLALFVSLTGTSFFRLACFALHHLLSSRSPQSALYHQRQAILRNSASGTNALFSFIQLLWSGRALRQDYRPFRQILPMILYSAIIVCTFAIAGVYSSRIAALTGDEVLVSSPYSNTTRVESIGGYSGEFLDDVLAPRLNVFATYARDCYSNRGAEPANCGKFVKPQLSRSIDWNASCPFQSHMCRSAHGNIRIDTGLIDSHWDLGMNSPASRRFQFRHVLSCAPIVTEGYKGSLEAVGKNFRLGYTAYYYGPVYNKFGNLVPEQNFTHIQMDFGSEIRNFEERRTVRARYGFQGYTARFEKFKASFEKGDAVDLNLVPGSIKKRDRLLWGHNWDPIPGLQSNNADISLIFLSANGICYREQVDDYWFSAHRDFNGSGFYADEAASPLACSAQYQLCTPPEDNAQCTQLVSLTELWRSRAESNLAEWFNDMLLPGLDTMALVSYLGNVLQIEEKGGSDCGHMADIPTNQWQSEVVRWSAILLASLQNGVVDFAAGPADERLLRLRGPRNAQEYYIVQNQKVRNTAYSNFSVLGLVITFSIGGLILVIESALECFYVRRVWKKLHSQQYPRLEWCVNGTLQLQRLAHEQLGYGVWSNCDEQIPILMEEAMLATLDLVDPKHPRLKAWTKEGEDENNHAEQDRPDTLFTGDNGSASSTPSQDQTDLDLEVQAGSSDDQETSSSSSQSSLQLNDP